MMGKTEVFLLSLFHVVLSPLFLLSVARISVQVFHQKPYFIQRKEKTDFSTCFVET